MALTTNYQESAGTVLQSNDTASLTGWSISGTGSTIEINTDTAYLAPNSGVTRSIKATVGETVTSSEFRMPAFSGAPLDLSAAPTIGIWFYLPIGEAEKINGVGFDLNLYRTTGSTDVLQGRFYTTGMAKQGWNFMAFPTTVFTAVNGGTLAEVNHARLVLRKPNTTTLTLYIGPLLHSFRSRPKVVLTFDDAVDDGYWAFQQMEPYGYKGSLGIPHGKIGTDGGLNYLTVAEMEEMYAAGWDCSHHGDDGFSTITLATARQLIRDNLAEFRANGWTRGNEFGIFPLGQRVCSDASYDELRAMLIEEGVPYWRVGVNDMMYPAPYGIDDFVSIRNLQCGQGAAPNLNDAAAALAAVDKAITAGATLFLNFHQFVASGADSSLEWNESEFTALLAGLHARAAKIDVVSFTEWKLGLTARPPRLG
jgi:peptidoglycan/xylan/chitin deacetylase (PgdA/CDA1 family)